MESAPRNSSGTISSPDRDSSCPTFMAGPRSEASRRASRSALPGVRTADARSSGLPVDHCRAVPIAVESASSPLSRPKRSMRPMRVVGTELCLRFGGAGMSLIDNAPFLTCQVASLADPDALSGSFTQVRTPS